MPKSEQTALVGHVKSSANKEIRKTFDKDGQVVLITEVIQCSAFAALFIHANQRGHFFIGFNPVDVEKQWTVLAPKGSCNASTHTFENDKRRQYYPLYAMRAFHRAKLPVARLGFEPPPAVQKLRQDVPMGGTPGYNENAEFWKDLPPDDNVGFDKSSDAATSPNESWRPPDSRDLLPSSSCTGPISNLTRETSHDDDAYSPKEHFANKRSSTSGGRPSRSDMQSTVATTQDNSTQNEASPTSPPVSVDESLIPSEPVASHKPQVHIKITNCTPNPVNASITHHFDDTRRSTNRHELPPASSWSGSIPIPRLCTINAQIRCSLA
jgi:hypothetical protein